MFAGLNRDEQEWLNQKTNAERRLKGLPPLPETVWDELVMYAKSIASFFRRWRNR